jgi:hypothetical protein
MSNNNNNTDEIDEYEYVTYADKYFGDQPDNETIHINPIDRLKNEIVLKEAQINSYQTQIKKENNMIKFNNEFKDNNNNNNTDLLIMQSNIRIDNLTNEAKDLKRELNLLRRKYYKAVTENYEKYKIQLQNKRSEYEKIISNEPNKKNEYLKKIKYVDEELNKNLKDIKKVNYNISKIPILVPKNEGYEIDNGLLGAKRDINIKLMAKLKNESLKNFVGISKEHNTWKNHFLFKILRNAGPMFIKHSKTDGFDLSNKKYILNTGGAVGFIFDELMDKNTGTYQISFQNIQCEKLEDVEIGVLPITKKYKEGNLLNREYGMNFAGHPLVFKQFWGKFLRDIPEVQQQTNQFEDYNRFVYHHQIFPTPKNSILTLQLNTEDGTMIFFVNSRPMEYICDIKESDFPCKFFVFNIGLNTTVRMTRFKRVNTYFRNIEPGASAIVYKPTNPENHRFKMKHGEIVYEDDDEEREVDEVLTEFRPRIVSWDAPLL